MWIRVHARRGNPLGRFKSPLTPPVNNKHLNNSYFGLFPNSFFNLINFFSLISFIEPSGNVRLLSAWNFLPRPEIMQACNECTEGAEETVSSAGLMDQLERAVHHQQVLVTQQPQQQPPPLQRPLWTSTTAKQPLRPLYRNLYLIGCIPVSRACPVHLAVLFQPHRHCLIHRLGPIHPVLALLVLWAQLQLQLDLVRLLLPLRPPHPLIPGRILLNLFLSPSSSLIVSKIAIAYKVFQKNDYLCLLLFITYIRSKIRHFFASHET